MGTPITIDLSLYVVTDAGLAENRNHEEVAQEAFAGGANVVQLRDKNAETRNLCEAGYRIGELAVRSGGLFIVNDRIDVAMAVNAHGVHLGQADMPAQVARKLMGPSKIIGVSLDHPSQARQAELDGANYVAIGPIYDARGTKADAGSPIGAAAITEVRRRTRLPIVAIGGIKQHHIKEVVSAGADGIAVISAVVASRDIASATRDLKQSIEEARR